MGDPRWTALSVCTGIGGLDLGLSRYFRVVGACEQSAFSASVLLARMEEATLDPCPLWVGDLAELDAAPFLGVDLLFGGVPCQPFSFAGQRKGVEDPRWLGESFLNIARQVEPRWILVENVHGFVRKGLPALTGALAECGYDSTWDLFRASDLDPPAPHRRSRCFLLAWRISNTRSDPLRIQPKRGDGSAQAPERGDTGSGGVGETVADAGRERFQGQPPSGTEAGATGRSGRAGVADADRKGLRGGWQSQHSEQQGSRGSEPLRRRAYGGLEWPPSPKDTTGWKRWTEDGGPAPAVERGVCRDADGTSGGLFRADRLRALGNAVVPDCATLAWEVLSARAGIDCEGLALRVGPIQK